MREQIADGEIAVGIQKQNVILTDSAFAFARELIDSGEYPNISAAVSGEMARSRAARERERLFSEARIRHFDTWEPFAATDNFTANVLARSVRHTQAD